MVLLFLLVGVFLGWLLTWIVFSNRQPGETPPRIAPHSPTCPLCDEYLRAGEGSRMMCRACGWRPTATVDQAQASALRALGMRARRMMQQRLLSPQSHEHLTAALNEEISRLEQPVMPLAWQPPAAAAAVEFANVYPVAGQQQNTVAAAVDEPAAAAPELPPDEVVASQTVAMMEADAAPREAAQPSSTSQEPAPEAPTTPLHKLLLAFMEERNVRWGELVGGLLIVCCSIALVFSFWSQIAQRPLAQFLLFNGVTAGLFGLGFYVQRRFKLPTTSQGVLVIASLLVPLNFLAIAAIAQGTAPGDPLLIAGETASLVLFTWLTWTASHTLAGTNRAALVSGILVPSALLLVIGRLLHPPIATPQLWALTAPLIGSHVAAVVVSLRRQGRKPIDEATSHRLLRLLGITGFASLLGPGLLLHQSGNAAAAAMNVAPLLAILPVATLLVGLRLWRGTPASLTGLRVIGTTLVLTAAAGGVACLVVAWANPSRLLPVAAINYAILCYLAVRYRLPILQYPGGACLLLAGLLIHHLVRGLIVWQPESPAWSISLVSLPTGQALLPLSVVLLATAWAFRRLAGLRHALPYAHLATIGSVAGPILLALLGMLDADRAVRGEQAGWFLGYALLAMAVSVGPGRVLRLTSQPIRFGLAIAGCVAMYTAVALAIVDRWAGTAELELPWLAANITYAALMSGLVIVLGRWNRQGSTPARCRFLGVDAGQLHDVATIAAVVMAVASLLMWLTDLWLASLAAASHYACGLAVVWLLVALITDKRPVWLTARWLLAAAVVLQAALWESAAAWYAASQNPWLDVRMLQAVGIALAVFSLAWLAARLALQSVLRRAKHTHHAVSGERAARWLTRLGRTDWPLAAAATVLAVLLAVYAALPGAAQELTPRGLAVALASPADAAAGELARQVPDAAHFELLGVPHEPAAGMRTWLLLALAAVWLVGSLWERFSTLKVVGLLIAAAAIVPLVAAGWEQETAVASALRWGTAAAFAVFSAFIWMRGLLHRLARLARWPGYHQARGLRPAIMATTLTVALLPLVMMAAYVALAALQHYRVEASLAAILQQSTFVAVVAGLVGVALAVTTMPAAEHDHRQTVSWESAAGVLLAVLGIGPMVAVAIYTVSLALRANPIVGPEPGSFFQTIGLGGSYVTPAALIAATLVGYALRERSARFAFAGGLALNLCATAGYLFSIKSGAATDALWLNVAWLNAITAAGYSILWSLVVAVAARRNRAAMAGNLSFHPLHATYAAIPIAIAAGFILIRLWELFEDPTSAAQWPGAANGALAWSAILMTAAAASLYWHLRRSAASGLLLAASVANLSLFAALATAAWDNGNWLTFHMVQGTAVALGWALTVYSRIDKAGQQPSQQAMRFVGSALATVAALWSLRSWGPGDPQVALSVTSLVALATLAAYDADAGRTPRRLFRAAALINVAAWIGWCHFSPMVASLEQAAYEFFAVNVIALCMPVPVWVAIGRRIERAQAAEAANDVRTNNVPGPSITIDRLASWAGLVVVAILVWQGLSHDAWGGLEGPPVGLVTAAWAAVLVAVAARLWAPQAQHVGPALYLTGAIGFGLALDALNLEPHLLAWLGVSFAGSYAVATSYLGSRQDRFLAELYRLGMLRPYETAGSTAQTPTIGAPQWLEHFNLALSTLVVAASVAMSLTLIDPSLRITAAKAGIVQAVAVGLLARGRHGSNLQRYALVLFSVGAVALAWSFQQPGLPWPILPRAVAAMIALAMVSGLLALGPGKFLPRLAAWTPASRWCLPYVMGGAAVALTVALASEIHLFYKGAAIPLSAGGVVSLIVATAGLAAAAIVAAVVPGRDPFALSQRQRIWYVYAAEGLLAAMLLHIRITMPWLFSGFFSRYWPIIAMAVAFAGLGLAEIFRRQRRWELAEPLERTGALLPLLTVMAFWTLPSQVDISFALLLAGLSYAAVSVMRRSFAYGIAATVAANAALWCLLDRTENWQLLQHPQVWMIPPALCVLAAVQLNRHQLTASQLTAARYAAALAIYVSSTAEVFLHGAAQTPWLAGVLAGLSVAGIFAGIGLRVRGFLYLGTSFLVVSLITLIRHAAVDLEQTWLWSAAGIVLGVAILVLFAVFEKKRHEVLGFVDRLRQWEA